MGLRTISMLVLLLTLSQLCAAVTFLYNVDCGSECPTNYQMTRVQPSAQPATPDPAITCAVGDVVSFNLANIVASHPFQIKLTPNSPGGQAYQFASPNTPVELPGFVNVTCDQNLCNQAQRTVYYQCTRHSAMSGSITITGCGGNPPVAPTPVAPPTTPPGPPTICEKYATALRLNQTALMNTIVNAVVTAELANPRIQPFFNGTQPPGSTNFLANPGAAQALSGGLVAFFGAALGCRDPAFPRYTGPPDMKVLHQPMFIGRTESDIFNDIFIQTLQNLGVDAGDRTTIRGVLDSFTPAIVNPAAICPKYAKALRVNQTALMTTIVSAIVGNLLGNATMRPFFDGRTPAGSTNFTSNQAAFNLLAGHLISFFGAPLGCTEPGFPAYDGNPDMAAVHRNMPIGRREFDIFNEIFVNTLAPLGVELGDRVTIRGILDSFAGQIVNPRIICPTYATALRVNQTALMTTIVSAVVTNLLADSLIRPFFDGRTPAGSTDFTRNTQSFNTLAGHLISFFGAPLGCNEPGFPAYDGNPDMKAVHRRQPISDVEFKRFNDIFITTLGNLGVTVPDRVTIRAILDSFDKQIINPTYICPKYAGALRVTEVQLMNTIVTAVVQAEVADPRIRMFFDGTIPAGSTNFLTNTDRFNKLVADLVAFFGAPLGCTRGPQKRQSNPGGFPAYTGNTDMAAVHRGMGITSSDFDKFNDIFIQTLANLGVTMTDQVLIRSLLDTFEDPIVRGSATPGAPTTTPTGPAPPGGSPGDPDLVALGYTLNQNLSPCDIVVYWKPLTTSSTEVSFAVRRRTDGYVAVGWPQNGAYQMPGSDAVIGWVAGGVADVKSYKLNARAVGDIVPNDLMPITDARGDETNGVTTIFFTRTLASGQNPITNPAATTIIGSTLDGFDGLRFHATCFVQSTFTINLVSGGSNQTEGSLPANPKKDAHGALMLSGWGIFFVLGLLVSAYGRDVFKDGLWFKFHQFFQTFGLILTTIAFILAWIMTEGNHFNTKFHAQLGTAIMSIVYFQFLSGVFRPHLKPGDADKTTARKIFEFMHPWTGRVLILAATVNIFAGINTWWPFWVHIIYAIIVAIFSVFAIAAEIWKRTHKKSDSVYYSMAS